MAAAGPCILVNGEAQKEALPSGSAKARAAHLHGLFCVANCVSAGPCIGKWRGTEEGTAPWECQGSCCTLTQLIREHKCSCGTVTQPPAWERIGARSAHRHCLLGSKCHGSSQRALTTARSYHVHAPPTPKRMTRRFPLFFAVCVQAVASLGSF